MIISKHKTATEDYNKAYSIVTDIELHNSVIIEIDNKKAFRKYISDLSLRAGKKFTTRSISDYSLNVIRIE